MAAGLGSLADYAAAAGSAVPDIAGTAGAATGLGSILGLSNPITLIPSLASLGLNLAGINPLQDILSSLQGLPASTKPDMYASYLSSLGGLPADLGSLINAAQQQVGPGTGLLSMSGAGAFNPNFMATLLEALTGQNLGNVDPTTGKVTFTAPATGGVQNPVTQNYLGESALMSSPGMAGLSAYGFTPQQLSSPAALKAIEQATNYGLVGTGQNLGTQKVAQYLPQVVAALESAGITPATGPGSVSQYLNQPQQGDTGTTTTTTTGGGGGGGDIVIPLGSLGSTGGGGTTTGGGGGTQLQLPLGSVSNLINTSPSTATSSAVSNPVQNITFTQLPSAKFAQGYTGLGFARPGTISPVAGLGGTQAPQTPIGVSPVNIPQQGITTQPVITPQMDMSGVGGGIIQLLQSLLGGGGGGGTSTASAQPWTVAG